MATNLPLDSTPAHADAYELLSRPTLDYTDEEVAKVVADLRRRRTAFLTQGKADRPKAAKKEAVKLSADDKARNTQVLLASLVIPGLPSPKKD